MGAETNAYNWERFRDFAATEIAPFAQEWDKVGEMPDSAILAMANGGLLGLTLPLEFGGGGQSQGTLALLTEAVGAVCSSARSLLTVHLSLVGETLARWSSAGQKSEWLPLLARGEKIAAFALSEPEVGSDAASVQTTYTRTADGYVLNGTKRWITFGQRADLYLVIARADGEYRGTRPPVSAFLLPRTTPGLAVVPIEGMLGTRASRLGELQLRDCFLPKTALLGGEGWGFLQIANTALDNGRFSVACGALGILRACLEASANYSKARTQHGQRIAEHQLIRRKLAEMGVEAQAARLLIAEAARLRDLKQPESILATTTAKYFASRAAGRAAWEAIQIHGAAGCHPDAPVQRYWRDARILEIIEGSDEMLEILLGGEAARNPNQFLGAI